MNNVYKAVIIMLLPLILLLTTLELVSFNTDYFMKKYEEYNISKSTGIEQEDLRDITDKLLGYLKDDEDNLDIVKTISGTEEQVFGEREVLHMVDVKDLFLKGRMLRNISFILVILSLLALIRKDMRAIGKTFIITSVVSLTSIVVLFLLMYVDFNKYFTYFHEIFFKNDLWLLDPDTDVLIQMLPLEFFYTITTKISTLFIAELLIIAVIGIFISRNYKISNGN